MPTAVLSADTVHVCGAVGGTFSQSGKLAFPVPFPGLRLLRAVPVLAGQCQLPAPTGMSVLHTSFPPCRRSSLSTLDDTFIGFSWGLPTDAFTELPSDRLYSPGLRRCCCCCRHPTATPVFHSEHAQATCATLPSFALSSQGRLRPAFIIAVAVETESESKGPPSPSPSPHPGSALLRHPPSPTLAGSREPMSEDTMFDTLEDKYAEDDFVEGFLDLLVSICNFVFFGLKAVMVHGDCMKAL
ncbi:hypothetical protein B0H17DRAFT_1203298 [Mycena rosella]|uniref:Uncharacterized protein n=1 Tax=Mycena rosella TaxID=1033263 RepID=A0AAD7GCG8_MYCRO|nr:hypothetical protein B0H17DRAFT_1203298 [Mycena rosella]